MKGQVKAGDTDRHPPRRAGRTVAATIVSTGFLDGLGDGYDIVSKLPTDCDQTKGLNAAQDMLTANPDIAAIYGACGPPIIGALEAIKTAGKTLVTVGFDAGPDEITAILAGTETASVAQFPAKMGELGRRHRIQGCER